MQPIDCKYPSQLFSGEIQGALGADACTTRPPLGVVTACRHNLEIPCIPPVAERLYDGSRVASAHGPDVPRKYPRRVATPDIGVMIEPFFNGNGPSQIMRRPIAPPSPAARRNAYLQQAENEDEKARARD